MPGLHAPVILLTTGINLRRALSMLGWVLTASVLGRTILLVANLFRAILSG